MPNTRNIGLARALSKLGYCSRKQATALIRAGHVTLNGKVQRNPEHPVRLESDQVAVDGECVRAATKIYVALNKPRGVVTTTSDDGGRDTVYRFLNEKSRWLAPVGRLDKASEGLLLFTNDSEWAARILDPAKHLDKTYHVRINAPADQQLIDILLAGVSSQGERLKVKSARILRGGARRTWLEIILDEGKNRHIRRMFEQLGIEVIRLVRIAIGPLQLGNLPKGSTRPLTNSEKKAFDTALKGERSAVRLRNHQAG